MSNTPRTDAARLRRDKSVLNPEGRLKEIVPAGFARTLETENAQLRAALERATDMLERVTRRGGFVVGCDAAAKVQS